MRSTGRSVRHASVAIIGSGFSGLAAAIELKRSGIDDFVILERAASLGGTWRDNHYPGCACDVPSHLYSFSFAPKHDWSRAFAPQAEIRAYLERVADDFDVRGHLVLGADVDSAAWDDGAAIWRLRAKDGRALTAGALVLGIGALSNPAYPRLRGIERFAGRQMHSARWDHGYDFAGKRVAVIGTGASAIQLVPALQPLAGHMFVVQRTPPWVLPKPDRAFSALEKAALRIVPGLRWLYRQSIFLRLEGRVAAFEHPALMRLVEYAGKRNIAAGIADPDLRARVTPSYTPGCKRILLSNEYYPALGRPNVEVVSDPVFEVTEDALVLEGGRRLAVDAIVYGTGFRVHDYLGGMTITGRGGASLRDAWREDGAQAYLGTTVAGFPNLFVMTGPNTGLGHNSMVVMIEGQARWVGKAIRFLRDRGLAAIEPRADVQARYVEWLRGRSSRTVWKSGCASWYLDDRGRNTTIWPGLASSYRARAALFRERDFVVRARQERGVR